MDIINDKDFKFDKPTAVTIGKFDGVHLGHQRLMLHTEHYRKNGFIPVVFTFSMHPDALIGGNIKQFIYTEAEKESIISDYKIDYLIKYPFTTETVGIEPEDFFNEILLRKLNAKIITVGEDFRFGHERKGDVEMLENLAEKHGVLVDVINRECIDGQVICSTLIRRELSEGNIDIVNAMLGKPYSIYGKVVRGMQLGRKLGMPTINLETDELKLLPPRGVYSSRVIYNGKKYAAVTNIGIKPTIDGVKKMGIESYMFDFDEEIYGEDVIVEILYFQRPEVKFADLELLKNQMHADKEQADKVNKRYK